MSMEKRTYTKKSDYWSSFDKASMEAQPAQAGVFIPELSGDPFYTSLSSIKSSSNASYSRKSPSVTSSRKNVSALTPTIDRYGSIRNGLLPYDYALDGVNVREAIELCQKAYANVAVFRNAIDIMSEFANTELYLEGGTKKSRDFFTEWFKRIKIWNLKDQYFREYYRGGNIFLYRVDGKFKADDFALLVKQIGELSQINNSIPVKYILLNPFDVVAKRSSSFAIGAYEKILSEYELSRLQTPITEEDRDILNGLPPKVREQIKKGTYFSDGLKIELDPSKLTYSFYKKQDYEPFAVPFGFSVLEDINAKLELKKMDQAITRTVENVILLITMGAEPDKGGINAHNLQAMQGLFRNESVGRVLVSDYTTKADFVIPDLNKVLGSEKYKVLNEDIKQGLQNIVIGEEKYSATEVKAQIFVDRLKESRNAFLNDFLQVEIKRIAKNLGFRSYPTACFRDIDIRDQTQLMRVSTRLMELGILTPQQGMEMFQTGQFPKPEDISPSQTTFIQERKDGFYNPLVGGIPLISPPDSLDSPINKTNKVPGRPEGTTGIPITQAQYSVKNIHSTIKKMEQMRASATVELKAKFKIKKLSKQQQSVLDQLCEKVIVAKDVKNWEFCATSCVNDFEKISLLQPKEEILSILAEHQLEDDLSAAILYHSNKINEN